MLKSTGAQSRTSNGRIVNMGGRVFWTLGTVSTVSYQRCRCWSKYQRQKHRAFMEMWFVINAIPVSMTAYCNSLQNVVRESSVLRLITSASFYIFCPLVVI